MTVDLQHDAACAPAISAEASPLLGHVCRPVFRLGGQASLRP
jgi:hypothetical protein